MFAKHFARRTGLNITVENDDVVVDEVVETPVDKTDEVVEPGGDASGTADTPDAVPPVDGGEVVIPPVDVPEVVETPVDGTPEAITAPEVLDTPEVELDLGDEEFDAAEAGFAEVDVEVDNINTAADQGETLDAIADKLEVQEENGGATPETMEIVEVAVEHCIATLQGFHPRQRVTPALEAFGGAKRRVHSTHVTVEGIREWANVAAKAIGEMVAKIIAFLKNVWASITGGTAKMKKSVMDLRAKLKAKRAADGAAKAATGDVSIPKAMYAKLKLGGQFSKELFFKGVENSKAFVIRVLNLMKVTRNTAVQTANATDESSEDGGEPKVDIGPMAQAVKDFGGSREEQGEGVVTVTEMEALPGDVSAEVTGPSGEVVDGVVYRAVSSVDVKLTGVATEDDVEDATIKGFTESEAEQALNEVEKLIKLADDAAAATKETIDVETKVLNVSKSKFQRFKDAATSVANKFKNFVGRVLGAIARPLGAVVRFLRGVIFAALMMVGIVIAAIAGTVVGLGTQAVNAVKGNKE